MHNARRPAALAAVLSLSALACSVGTGLVDPNAASTAVAQTVSAGKSATEAVLSAAGTLAASLVPPASQTPAASATPQATDTPLFTATPSASPTLTETPTPAVPLASLTQNTNCRSGPLAVYDLIRTFLTGETAQITGKDAGGDYWYVTDPSQPGKDCWLWGRYVTISGDTGNVPVFTPPPTPTPSYIWTGHWDVWVTGNPSSMDLTQSGTSVTGTYHASSDYGITGTTSEGGRTLSGTVLGPAVAFVFRMTTDTNQFTGYYATTLSHYDWCGARNGAGQPSPCQGP
jgi:hypothetical protein